MPRKAPTKSASSISLVGLAATGDEMDATTSTPIGGGGETATAPAPSSGAAGGVEAGMGFGSLSSTAKRVETQQTKALKSHGIDQFELPKSVLTRLAKSEVPETVQLRKEVVTALVKASTVFISYLTATSHDQATSKGLKTISAANVLQAVKELDLPQDVRVELKRELEAYRTIQKSKRKSTSTTTTAAAAATSKGKIAAPTSMEVDESMDADVSRMTNAVDDEDDDDDERESGTKKQKRDGENGAVLRGKLANEQGQDDEDEDEDEDEEEEDGGDQEVAEGGDEDGADDDDEDIE